MAARKRDLEPWSCVLSILLIRILFLKVSLRKRKLILVLRYAHDTVTHLESDGVAIERTACALVSGHHTSR